MCPTLRARYLGFTALACLSIPNLASAAATMETIGAEKCGGRITAFEVEFLAPDGAALEATAKALVRGAPSLAQNAVTLSIDGKPCADARCRSRPAKARPTNSQPRRNCAILRSFASSLPGPDGYLLLRYRVFYPSPSLCRHERLRYSSIGFAGLTAAPQSILSAGGSPQHGELNYLVEIAPRFAPGPGQRGSERLAQAPD